MSVTFHDVPRAPASTTMNGQCRWIPRSRANWASSQPTSMLMVKFRAAGPLPRVARVTATCGGPAGDSPRFTEAASTRASLVASS